MELNTVVCKIHHDSACLLGSQQLLCYVRGSASISLGASTCAHVCTQLRHCMWCSAAIISQVNEKKKPVVYIQFCLVAAQPLGSVPACMPACSLHTIMRMWVGCIFCIFDVFYFVIRQQRQQPHKSLLITFPLQTQIHTHTHPHITSRICHFTLLSHELVINILNLHLSIFRSDRYAFSLCI